ncbi:MAG: hypothetical protein ABUL56_00120 [Actinomycetota bacterium]
MTHDFARWRDAVVASLASRDDVVGVGGLGSTAVTSRADEYSDLDIFILTIPGAEDRYRHHIDWIPDADDVVLHLVEWHGGGKVLFADGRMIEWGVGTPAAVSTWLAGEGVVLFDRRDAVHGGAAEALAAAQANPYAVNDVNERNALATFVFAIHHGMGRVRRGEVVSGGDIIRSEAVAALLRAARAGLAAPEPGALDPGILDPIDVRRRVERAYPVLANDIANAVAQHPEPAARALLEMAHSHFGGRLPATAVAAVRERYAWTD